MNDAYKQAKHTRAPWEAKPFGTRGGDGPSCLRIYGANGEEIADTYDYTVIDGINANLISAAPDLLEVLQQYTANDDALEAGLPFDTYTQEYNRILALAKAAIAKAVTA